MNNLMPEKRLDRVGRLVTRWVKGDAALSKKNSILGTVIPTIPAAAGNYIRDTAESDKALRADLLRNLRLKIQQDFNNQPEVAKTSGEVKRAALMRMTDRLTKASQKMESLETSTLRALSETSCKPYSLMQTVTLRGAENELQFRERLHYMVVDDDGDGAMYNTRFIDAVRDALDVDDLSEYPHGSIEQEVVASTLRLLHQDWALRRTKSDYSPREKVDNAYMRQLLDFLMEQPEKALAIQEFLVERKVGLNDVDFALLDDYLNADIPALGSGLL